MFKLSGERRDRKRSVQHNVRDIGVRSLHDHGIEAELVAPVSRLLFLFHINPGNADNHMQRLRNLAGGAVHADNVRRLLRRPVLQRVPGAVGQVLQHTLAAEGRGVARRTERPGHLQEPPGGQATAAAAAAAGIRRPQHHRCGSIKKQPTRSAIQNIILGERMNYLLISYHTVFTS